MPTRDQVLRLLGSGLDYEEAARRLGVPAGQAYMIATGLPADGGDTLTDSEARRPGLLSTSSQHLANPQPAENPTSKTVVEEWLKQRANADEPMRRAAQQRSASPGEIREPDATRDATQLLTRDHDHVTALLKQLSTIPGHKKGGSQAQMSSRQSVVDMMTMILSQHESAEEEYLWPTVRRVLDDGDQLADEALGQEQEGKDLLTALGRAAPDSEEFDELVEQLSATLRKHVAYEDRVFAKLRDAMAQEDRDELGEKLLPAKKAAPTRPHRHSPQKPAGAVKAAGAAAAGMDRVRDVMGSRPAEREGQAEDETDD